MRDLSSPFDGNFPMNDERRPWDDALVGGREKRELVVVAYDPAWPGRFDTERRRIASALGDGAITIHHVGSTAVEGLAAKPVVDITVVVPAPQDESTYVPALEAAGYEVRVREPGHRMLRTPERDVHIHVWVDPSDVRRHLLFRDWLRRSAADRARYEGLKLQLAKREWDDMNLYADAKTELILEIMGRADAWAEETGWRVPGDGPARPMTGDQDRWTRTGRARTPRFSP